MNINQWNLNASMLSFRLLLETFRTNCFHFSSALNLSSTLMNSEKSINKLPIQKYVFGINMGIFMSSRWLLDSCCFSPAMMKLRVWWGVWNMQSAGYFVPSREYFGKFQNIIPIYKRWKNRKLQISHWSIYFLSTKFIWKLTELWWSCTL